MAKKKAAAEEKRKGGPKDGVKHVRTSISLPMEIKVAMEAHPEINWSKTAACAFRAALKNHDWPEQLSPADHKAIAEMVVSLLRSSLADSIIKILEERGL